LTHDLFIGLGSSFWNNSIYVTPSNYIASDAEFIPFKFKILPVTASFCGLFLALYLYNRQRKALFLLKKSYIGIKLYSFFNRKWFFDKVYNEKIAQTILYLGYFFTYKTIDRGAFEMMGPFGFTAGSLAITEALTKSQLGNVFTYISNIYLSFILTVFFFCAIETSIINVGWITFIKYMLGM
jgi:NADH-ubiquinone oxidoreductase chain 5